MADAHVEPCTSARFPLRLGGPREALPCEQRHGARTGYLFRRLPLRSEARQGAHG